MTPDTDPTEAELRRRLLRAYQILLACAYKQSADPRLVPEAGQEATADKAATPKVNTTDGSRDVPPE